METILIFQLNFAVMAAEWKPRHTHYIQKCLKAPNVFVVQNEEL